MSNPFALLNKNNQVELIAKGLPLALAGLYVVGFLIVAIHLAGYGTSSLDLFKIQYLAAGFWFGIVFLLFFGTTQPLRSGVSEIIDKTPRGVLWMDSVRALVGAIATDFTLLFFGFVMYKIQKFNVVVMYGAPLVLNLVGFDIALHIWLWLREKAHRLFFDPLRELNYRMYWRLFATFVVFAFLSCIVYFAENVYPKIPFAIGGGRTRQVVFWLGAGASPDSFLERDHSNPYTVSYELLLENENSFVVVSPKGGQRAIEFDRKSVAAMIVLGERPKSAPANFERPLSETPSAH